MALTPSHKPRSASSSQRQPSYGPHPSKNRKSSVVSTTPVAPTQPKGKGTSQKYTAPRTKGLPR